jgi:hypothetical protein
MIYRKRGLSPNTPGGFFHLEEEATKTRAFGYGQGDHIKLVDEYGNVWRGSAERADDNSIIYRFRDSAGRSLTGVSASTELILRDNHGKVWKGFIG